VHIEEYGGQYATQRKQTPGAGTLSADSRTEGSRRPSEQSLCLRPSEPQLGARQPQRDSGEPPELEDFGFSFAGQEEAGLPGQTPAFTPNASAPC